jgi:hypothetical protein
MKNSILIILVLLAASSCKMNQLYLNVTEPAPVTISPEIKKVGVINRSIPTDETKILDVLDKAFSLEGVNLDKDGAGECVNGLTEELMSNDRFSEIKNLSDIDFRTPKLGIFPVPLSWEIVSRICTETGTDALFALEYYDTDTRINYSSTKTEKKTPLGVIPLTEHIANMETIVKTGWRIYDPGRQVIADEFSHVQSVVFTGRGVNPLVAVAGLVGRKDAVKQVSNQAGHGYAMRLIPFRIRVYRDYFVKGTDNFKIAKRRAQMGNWDSAAELWEKETSNPDMKIAGRACYNMGIISEINGDPGTALSWVEKAYTDYNTRQAREYSNILRNRIMKNQMLEEQKY